MEDSAGALPSIPIFGIRAFRIFADMLDRHDIAGGVKHDDALRLAAGLTLSILGTDELCCRGD